ncbi:unnamed protein product [Phaeothamnion confervicola]
MLSRRDLSTLPLAPSVLEKLLRCGFRTVADVHGLTPIQVSAELAVSCEEALQILQDIEVANGGGGGEGGRSAGGHDDARTPPPLQAGGAPSAAQQRQQQLQPPASAIDLIGRGKGAKPIISFCRAIDDMLGGGVPRGELTEICGAPGVGKTQLCMQLAVNVQIPALFGGVGGQAIYIDTEGSMTVERLVQMADAAVVHISKIARSRGRQSELERASAWTRDALLANVFIFRVHDHVQQLATVRTLPRFLEDHPGVRVVVMDSVSFHFRHAYQDLGARSRKLNEMAQQLTELAQMRSVAVVLVNQMTTRIGGRNCGGTGGGSGGETRLVPALGETWAHAATNRLLLECKGGQRLARLMKSQRLPPRTVSYTVTALGVRDERQPGGGGGGNGGGDGSDGRSGEDGQRKRQRTEAPFSDVQQDRDGHPLPVRH